MCFWLLVWCEKSRRVEQFWRRPRIYNQHIILTNGVHSSSVLFACSLKLGRLCSCFFFRFCTIFEGHRNFSGDIKPIQWISYMVLIRKILFKCNQLDFKHLKNSKSNFFYAICITILSVMSNHSFNHSQYIYT